MSNYSVLMNSAIHEDADIIDVSDTLQHAQHEGYYSPNNTSNKATPYIFEKLVKSSSGNQIGARFKGQGDRQWVEIFVPTVDFTPNMQNFIALFNAEKGNVKIREEEMRKAARLLTNFFNSPSLPGNEKMTTYVRKPKSLKHALFTEVYDMDDYLEHHGILGMKWGVRRYQNEDGSLTDAGRKRYNVKATRAQLENAQTDAEKRLILTKSANKAEADMLGGMAGYVGGLMATAGLAAAFQTPLALIPAAVGVVNFARSVVYGAYKEMKLSELAAEFDVSTNVARSISNDNKPIKMLYDPSTTPEQAKELDKMYSQYTGRSVESTIRQPSNNSTNRSSSGPRYTPEQQREKLQTAKNNDRYDLDFLEFMQNTKISYDDNKTAMDKAYKEYLKDPEAFATDPDFYKKYPYA